MVFIFNSHIMKRKLFFVGAVAGLLAMSACNKQQAKRFDSPNPPLVAESVNKITLKDFENSEMTKDEKPFFQNTKVTDNTRYLNATSSIQLRNTATEVEKPKLKFKWAGKKSGCTFPLGICIIIPFGQIADDSFTQVDTKISDDKLVILFPENSDSNFGLTADGYLPILNDIPIPSNMAQRSSLTTKNPKIQAGIYKANYDSQKKKYVGVVLNLD